MDARPSSASPEPEGAAPPKDGPVPPLPSTPPVASTNGPRRTLMLAAAATVVAVAGAVAGYRLYQKDRAETAAELVRINAYLAVKAQAEATQPTRKQVEKPLVQPMTQAVQVDPPSSSSATRAVQPARPIAAAKRPPQKKSKPAASPPPAPLAAKPKNVDHIYTERSARECAVGFVGFICRESLKIDLCREHEAYGKASICPAEKPAPQPWPGAVG